MHLISGPCPAPGCTTLRPRLGEARLGSPARADRGEIIHYCAVSMPRRSSSGVDVLQRVNCHCLWRIHAGVMSSYMDYFGDGAGWIGAQGWGVVRADPVHVKSFVFVSWDMVVFRDRWVYLEGVKTPRYTGGISVAICNWEILWKRCSNRLHSHDRIILRLCDLSSRKRHGCAGPLITTATAQHA